MSTNTSKLLAAAQEAAEAATLELSLALKDYEQRYELLAALKLLEGWVSRVVVPSYTDRKPMPTNAVAALTAAKAAIARCQPTEEKP